MQYPPCRYQARQHPGKSNDQTALFIHTVPSVTQLPLCPRNYIFQESSRVLITHYKWLYQFFTLEIGPWSVIVKCVEREAVGCCPRRLRVMDGFRVRWTLRALGCAMAGFLWCLSSSAAGGACCGKACSPKEGSPCFSSFVQWGSRPLWSGCAALSVGRPGIISTLCSLLCGRCGFGGHAQEAQAWLGLVWKTFLSQRLALVWSGFPVCVSEASSQWGGWSAHTSPAPARPLPWSCCPEAGACSRAGNA